MSGNITLTERETELFSILKKTLDRNDLKTTLRCAGGWVRDKLLNLDSDDIDIALDDMLGKDFAEHVNEYLISQNANAQKVWTRFDGQNNQRGTLLKLSSSVCHFL